MIVHSVLGSGSFGVVFLATKGKVEVAIKRFRAPLCRLGEKARGRRGREKKAQSVEVRECRALQRVVGVSHCVQLLGSFSTPDGRARYIIMEYCSGGSLRGRVREGGAVGLVKAKAWLLQLLAALSFLHSRGLVHRDVKPGNVLVGHGDRNLRLADFGCAKRAGSGNAFVVCESRGSEKVL